MLKFTAQLSDLEIFNIILRVYQLFLDLHQQTARDCFRFLKVTVPDRKDQGQPACQKEWKKRKEENE
jgi:hypothetical protein